jgi:capsular polysaccharide biosynthesis protein
VNIGDVTTMIAGYTTHPVRLITTGHNTTGAQQAEMFYTTDILISTHGSQLANMVFAPNLSK